MIALARTRLGRPFVLVLVGLLVPLMALTSGPAAQAATPAGWGGTSLRFDFPGARAITVYGVVTCNVSLGRQEDGGLAVAGDCSGPADVSPGLSQPGEVGSPYKVRVTGPDPSCGSLVTQGDLKSNPQNGITKVAGTIPVTRFANLVNPFLPAGRDCQPTGVCLGISEEEWIGAPPVFELCGPVSVPELEEDSCPNGKVQQPYTKFQRKIDNGQTGKYSGHIKDIVFKHEGYTYDGQNPNWYRYLVMSPLGAPEGGTRAFMDLLKLEVAPEYYDGRRENFSTLTSTPDKSLAYKTFEWEAQGEERLQGGLLGTFARSKPYRGGWGESDDGPVYVPVGYGYLRGLAGKSASGAFGATPMAKSATDQPLSGLVGVNNPDLCQFYWGVKLWDDGATGGPDEPQGPLPEKDGDDPGAAPPVAGHETPDEEHWWENIWGRLWNILDVLRDILGAIIGIPGKIVSAIGNLLKDLFIPDDWPDWSNVDPPIPSGYVPDFPSVFAGECGAIAMPDVDLGMVDVEAARFVDTCDAPWTTIRTMTYYGLLASVLLVVGNRLLRVIMTGLGMGVDTPAGGADE